MKYLENEFIRLRALEPEDLDVLYKWENDTALWEYGSTMMPFSRYILRDYIEHASTDIYQQKQVRFMIVAKDTGEAMGTIDLFDFDPYHLRAAVGILVDTAFRGSGVAGQSLQLLAGYAFGFLHLRQLYVHVPVSNEVSLHLFRNAGFAETGRLKEWLKWGDAYNDVCVMQRINEALSV